MTQQDIATKIKVLKITKEIDNQFIADYLGMRNARSVANFLHGDYNLSDEKRLTIKESQLKDEKTKMWQRLFRCSQYIENCMTNRASLWCSKEVV